MYYGPYGSGDDRNILVAVSLMETKGITDSEDVFNWYTDELADKLEELYKSFLNGAKIDRRQLYGELYFHYDFMVQGIMIESASTAEINIYADGSVRDERDAVNSISASYAGGYRGK